MDSTAPYTPLVFGIDPGMDGAVALICGDSLSSVIDMPTTLERIGKNDRRRLDEDALLAHLKTVDTTANVVVEVPQPRPGNSVVGAFASGMSWALLLRIVKETHHVLTKVPPQLWKREAGLIGGSKLDSVVMAEGLWPSGEFRGPKGGLKDGRAEACLIARFGSVAS